MKLCLHWVQYGGFETLVAHHTIPETVKREERLAKDMVALEQVKAAREASGAMMGMVAFWRSSSRIALVVH